MMQKNMSPEERLLSLLRKKKKPAQAPADSGVLPQPAQGEKRNDPKRPSRAPFSFTFSKDMFISPSFLHTMNIYLAAVVMIFTVYLVWDFAKSGSGTQGVIDQLSAGHNVAQEAKIISGEVVSALQDYAVYSAEIVGKKIFGQLSDADKGAVRTTIAPEDVQSKLGLVGVVMGDSPQAIIEDKKSQKVYYLTKGQAFDIYTVIDISEGRVTLEADGKQIALVL